MQINVDWGEWMENERKAIIERIKAKWAKDKEQKKQLKLKKK